MREIQEKTNENINLVVEKDGELLTTSRKVAEKFNRQHKNVLQSIDILISDLGMLDSQHTPCKAENQYPFLFFEKVYEKNPQNGKMYPVYNLNEDAFILLTMGFTGSEALKCKLAYMAEFNRMRTELKKRSTTSVIPDRRFDILKVIGRATRYQLDAICKLFPEYFGSTSEVGTLERRCDLNTSYQKWVEDYGITLDWIGNFPTTDIFNNYVRYCNENNMLSMGKKLFYHTIEEDFCLIKKQRSGGYRYFVSA